MSPGGQFFMSPDTAVIYGTERAKIGTPEAALQGLRLCVTGFVSFFRQRPDMILQRLCPGELHGSAECCGT
jgi:hypothetical protein